MLARTPPMGFNTYNTFGTHFDENLLRQIADAMVERGFRDAGYEYIVIDDFWAERNRDPLTDRLVPSQERFPSGIKALADYIHSKGMKFGIYSCSGVRTCGNYPGSFDHEFLDARTFAEWGIDFLKYDNCNVPEGTDGQLLYRRMGLALRECGREILFSACNWGINDVYSWIRSTGAAMYRTTGDIFDNFKSFTDIYQSQLSRLGTSAPYCWNDLDMLTVGMYTKHGKLSLAEYQLQFAAWCIFSAPLILGCDPRNVIEESRQIMLNPELLRINQDPEGRPPFMVNSSEGQVYAKLLSDGEYAFLFANTDDRDRDVKFIMPNMGLTYDSGLDLSLTDLYTGEAEGVFRDCVTVRVPKMSGRIFRGKLIAR